MIEASQGFSECVLSAASAATTATTSVVASGKDHAKIDDDFQTKS